MTRRSLMALLAAVAVAPRTVFRRARVNDAAWPECYGYVVTGIHHDGTEVTHLGGSEYRLNHRITVFYEAQDYSTLEPR